MSVVAANARLLWGAFQVVDGSRRFAKAAIGGSATATIATTFCGTSIHGQTSRRIGGGAKRMFHAAECEDGNARRRPVGGTAGSCDSGIRFYAARSTKATESSSCFVIAERLHQFAVLDGLSATQEAGSECAKFCGQRLPSLVAQAFMEQPPLRSRTGQDGTVLDEDEAVASAWADALTLGFGRCDALVANEQLRGACGAVHCVIARSGVYIASVGLGRAVIGTEEDEGSTVHCDEASSPHVAGSELEVARLGSSASSFAAARRPTRMLGALDEKRAEPLLLGLPDVVRHAHSQGRRYVILGSPGIWANGPRLPVQWAVEAYRKGRSPADELVARAPLGTDVVALVVVIPGGLGAVDSPLPAHENVV